MRIFFIPRWYPTLADPMTGLFIQRQAEALAVDHDVVVLYLYPDPDCVNTTEIDYAEEKGVKVIRVSFSVFSGVLSVVLRPFLAFRYWQSATRGLSLLGSYRPDVVHSHVLTRAAVIGYWLSRRWGVPHIISEHWSRYFRQNSTYRGFLRKRATRRVVHEAAGLIPVSVALQEALHEKGILCRREAVIPNVVDTGLFGCKTPVDKPAIKQFIHVSCFEEKSKNITGLLEAVRFVKEKRSDFRCLLVGEGADKERLIKEADRLGVLGSPVHFVGLKEKEELIRLYQESDFSVLCSRYETFGTVIPESLSCGTPVLSTRVGIAPDVITAENGRLMQDTDVGSLTEGLLFMLDNSHLFDPETVHASVAGLFSPQNVANQLVRFYQGISDDV